MKKNFSFLFILFVSLFLYNCGGGGGSSSSSSSSSSSTTFLDSGTSKTYTASTATTWAGRTEFDQINNGATSSQNPYEVLNVHKAYAYGLSGYGTGIAIMDRYMDIDHYEIQDKWNSTPCGTSLYASACGFGYGGVTADSGTNYHGNAVASIAAGGWDSNATNSMMGVAYKAGLHLTDYSQKTGDYYADHWADGTDNAKEKGMIVQNNSWGFTNVAYNSSTNYTSASVATLASNAGLTSNATSIDNYITALNSFQENGVIVYALSNSSGLSDADVAAALPEIYNQLNEAWITVGNVEITGSSGNETYTRKSAICGSTAEYCVVADGFEMYAAKNYDGSDSYNGDVGSGTSYAAPQVSGLIALLAEAFPSQTPSQLTDRILASADNSFFTASDNTSFANGITHGYNNTYGHGIPDIYAALQPITSSRMSESILIGNNIETASVYKLNKSNFSNGLIFGDSISNSFKGKKGYFYDALYGAFEYNFKNHLLNEKPKRVYNLEDSFDEKKFKSFSSIDNNSEIELNYSFVTDENNYLLPEEGIAYSISNNNYDLNAAYNYPLDLNLGFISSEDLTTFNNNDNILLPYLNSKDNSYNMSANIFKNKKSNLSLGYIHTKEKFSLNKKGYVLSYSNFRNDKAILVGIITESDGFLDNKFNGAFSMDNNDNPTSFIGFRHKAKLGKNKLMFVSTYGSTNVSTSSNSLIKNIDNVNTTSFSANLSRKELLNKKDRIVFSISQPQRVENGTMKYLVPKLNDKDGTLNYSEYETKLKPTGRQIDFSLDYIFNLNENTEVAFQSKAIDDYSHIAKDDLDVSLMTSIKYKF